LRRWPKLTKEEIPQWEAEVAEASKKSVHVKSMMVPMNFVAGLTSCLPADWMNEKKSNNNRASLDTINPNTTPMDLELWNNIDNHTNMVETTHVAAKDQGINNSVASGIML
jgi:hypothetical protein